MASGMSLRQKIGIVVGSLLATTASHVLLAFALGQTVS
jgi:hypothetical protein